MCVCLFYCVGYETYLCKPEPVYIYVLPVLMLREVANVLKTPELHVTALAWCSYQLAIQKCYVVNNLKNVNQLEL